MPNGIKRKGNEEIRDMLLITKSRRKLNAVQTRVLEAATRAAIRDAEIELFGN